jgi:hypothetical protein
MSKKLKVWNGASWEDVTFAIAAPEINTVNTFSINQIIDTSTSVAALRITQRGAGEAFRVEDETNLDSTPFVIDSSGNTGIGTSSPTNKLHVITTADYATARFESSGAEVNVAFASTSTNGRDWRIVSGGSGGGFSGGLFGIYDATAAAMRFYINSSGGALFNGNSFISQIGSVNKFEVQSGGIKIWAGRNNALEGGEMYLVSTGGTNGYNNTQDAVFDVYDGMVRLSPDGFGKIYNLRPAADNGTSIGLRNVTASTSAPSGGADGDMWAVYV